MCVVHNETSTGVASRVADVRAAMDAAGHDALLLVDTISSLGSIDYRHDEWGVDVTVGCSQKGLMLPPGLGFNAVSERALEASRDRRGCRASYWDWAPILEANRDGAFPYTPPTNLLYGLREALDLLLAEGLATSSPATRATPRRRAAPSARWGLELVPLDDREHSGVADRGAACPTATTPTSCARRSSTATTCRSAPASGSSRAGCSASATSATSTTSGSPGALAGVEMGLVGAGVPSGAGGVQAALDHLARDGGRRSRGRLR